MSPAVLALDLLLVALLVLTLVLGARLNGRLKGLKQSHAGFEKAVAELNQAAGRAEAGLAALQATSAETHDALLARIDAARALTVRLERATFQAEKAAEAVAKARADLPTYPAPRAEVAAPSSTATFQTPAPAKPLSRAPLSNAPLSGALASIAALVGDAPRSEGRMASPARPAPPAAAPRRTARAAFDEDLFESDPSDDDTGPPPRSALDARLSGLRNGLKDDRR
jgi:hypothetical protein